MSSESDPLNPRPVVRFGSAQYGAADRESFFSVDENNSTHIRIRRRTAYCLLGYVIITSILALACLLALLLSHTGSQHDTQQPPLHQQPPSPPPMPSDPSSPPLHSPLPARRDWNRSHVAHVLLLTDIHLEPHYNPTPNTQYGVCRDDTHINHCMSADWDNNSQPLQQSTRSQSAATTDTPFHFGRYMCDPPHSLVSAALHSLADSVKPTHLDVILLPGDLAAHFINCPRTLYSAINRTLTLVTTAFPSTPVVFSIGNTDTYPTSSLPPLTTQPTSLATMADAYDSCHSAFSPLLDLLLLHGVLDERRNEAAVRTFCHGGYYSTLADDGRVRIVSLNTLVWSTQLLDSSSQANTTHTDSISNYPSKLNPASTPVSCGERPDDPYGQLWWLQSEVRVAAESGQHVWLVGHIPPGVKADEQGWCWPYWQRVRQMLAQYEDVITQLHFGDYSQDMIRLVQHTTETDTAQSDDGGVSHVSHVLHINPGLSPRKNVNPAARVYTYNRSSSHIVDYQQLYIDLSRTAHSTPHHHHSVHWLHQYNALDTYGLSHYTVSGWLDVLRRMHGGGSGGLLLLERYMRGVNVWKAGVGDGVDYLCDALVMELDDNRRCKQTGMVAGLEG